MTDATAKKEEHRKFQAIRGTRDLLPPETALWNHVEQTAREVFSTFGYGEIRPPIFEQTDLFARAVGGETDIVSKEMYTFSDSTDSGDPQKDLVKKALDLGLGVELKDFEKAFGELSSLATRHSPLRSVSAPRLPPPSVAPISNTTCSNSRSR